MGATIYGIDISIYFIIALSIHQSLQKKNVVNSKWEEENVIMSELFVIDK